MYKRQIIFRATDQWFASIDGFREKAIEEIKKVDWIPTWEMCIRDSNKEIPEKPETKVANITGTKTVDKTEAKVGDTLTSVSYTHLDVYKRQRQCRS